MIIDALSLQDKITIKTDVCIVGAGVAGISLAHEFRNEPFRVCVLESGGFQQDYETQSLACGKSVGHPYYPLETTRARCFGGSSHRWLLELGENRIGARLRPLDTVDFEKRDWIPYSGWPFPKTHLDSYYSRAQVTCQIGPYTYEADDWEDPQRTPRLPFLNSRIRTTMFQCVPRDVFINHYREKIQRSENITTYLHSIVENIETNDETQRVSSLRVRVLGKKSFWVSSKIFVLALGGIETPRLLLLSNRTHRDGLGNQNDLVGRFFMEHPHLWSGYYFPLDPHVFHTTGLYRLHTVRNTAVMGALALSEDVLRSEKLLNYCVALHPSPIVPTPSIRANATKSLDHVHQVCSSVCRGDIPDFSRHLSTLFPVLNDMSIGLYRKFMRSFHALLGSRKFQVFRLNHMSEQVPNSQSRVSLSDERDAFGQPRVKLDWQLSPTDVHTIVRAQQIIDEELRHAGLGRLQIDLQTGAPPPELHGGWHHMGTTRMHVDSKMGVVNENAQVHEISNLFISGPSLFPTSGCANPTLTIVALAIRLGDHVKTLMNS
ncbi:GMC oxidoreductase [Candidatus Nitrospira salsa]